MKRNVLIVGVLVIILVALGLAVKDRIVPLFFRPTGEIINSENSTTPVENNQTPNTNNQEGEKDTPPQSSPLKRGGGEEKPMVVATGLTVPWEIAFLPDGRMLVTERTGTLAILAKDGVVQKRITVSGVEAVGEGGLLGLALHPDFSKNRLIYLYYTTKEGGSRHNQVIRVRFENDVLSEQKVIVGNLPASSVHNGGRIAFGKDGYLYITTGDAGNEDAAQEECSLAGKILRVKDDGSIPADNPFLRSSLCSDAKGYSYGHRNPQGLAWDSTGQLWATEHGRSGALSGLDEVNRIVKGENYGWPVIQGNETGLTMITPVINSGPEVTWAPAGMAIVGNRLFFAGLRGNSLYSAVVDGETLKDVQAHFSKEYGRLRAVVLGPDGYLYISTSNKDGRGSPKEGDDKILKISPEILK